jgi:hypothetical protein
MPKRSIPIRNFESAYQTPCMIIRIIIHQIYGFPIRRKY